MIIFIALITILSHFNVDVTALLATLGLIGLALSLAAQDTLNDIINGVLIWLDRPFRIGDRIEIQGDKMWGDVIDIGTRSTRILLIDNTMVIVPNSVIGKNQVINYSYPDSSIQTGGCTVPRFWRIDDCISRALVDRCCHRYLQDV